MKATFSPILDLIRLGRPLFLAGGFVFHALGLSMALLIDGRIRFGDAMLVQWVITASQLMTHYANDYFDRAGDALNQTPTPWSGGSRILPEGHLAPRVALVAALVCGLIAVAGMAALMLIARPGFAALPMMILGLGVGWVYSAPPIRLVGRGWGELIGALTVPGLTTILGFYVQTGRVDPLVIFAILPLVFLQFAMLLAVASPDVEADRASGKRTLVADLGRDRAGLVYALALASAYLLLMIYGVAYLGRFVLGTPIPARAGLAGSAALLTLPLAVWLGRGALRGAWRDTSRRGWIAFWSIALMIGTALIETAVFAWLATLPGPV